MKKTLPFDLIYQVIALIVAIIAVHLVYVTTIRPNADVILTARAEQAAAGENFGTSGAEASRPRRDSTSRASLSVSRSGFVAGAESRSPAIGESDGLSFPRAMAAIRAGQPPDVWNRARTESVP